MKNTLSFMGRLVGLLGLAVLVSIVAPEWASWLLSDGSGVLIAAVPIAGGVQTLTDQIDNNPDNLERDISDDVLLMQPDRFPLTTFMDNMKSARNCKAIKVEWQQADYFQRGDTIDDDNLAGSGGSPVVVKVANITNWAPSDIAYFPDTLVDNTELRARVLEVNYADNTLLLKALTVNNIPALSTGDAIIRQSNAKGETDAMTAPRASDPLVEWNYNQIFMMQVEISKIRKAISTYSGDDELRAVRQQLYDFRNNQENSHLFGYRSQTTDPITGDKVWTMSGVVNYIDKNLDYNYHVDVGLSNRTFHSWCRQLFNDNAGSEQRLMLVDEYLMEALLNVSSIEKQLEAKKSEVVYGIRVNRIETSFGELLIKYHKGFAENGRSHFGIALDMNHVRPRVLEPMQSTPIELDKTGQRRVKANRTHVTRTLEVRYPKTHAIIKGFDQAPPTP
jgi:hypothetical protein